MEDVFPDPATVAWELGKLAFGAGKSLRSSPKETIIYQPIRTVEVEVAPPPRTFIIVKLTDGLPQDIQNVVVRSVELIKGVRHVTLSRPPM